MHGSVQKHLYTCFRMQRSADVSVGSCCNVKTLSQKELEGALLLNPSTVSSML